MREVKQSQQLLGSYKDFVSCLKNKLITVLRNPSLKSTNCRTLKQLRRIGTATAGTICGFYLFKRQILTLECDVKHKKSRLVGLDHERTTEDVDFDWKQFGRLLWEDIFSLALAILVSVFISFEGFSSFLFTQYLLNTEYIC